MNSAPGTIAFIGFGEAASAFVEGFAGRLASRLVAYDRTFDAPAARAEKWAACEAAGVTPAASPAAALHGAQAVLSLVTADQALASARAGAAHLAPGALWLDMNSVAPDTKRAAATSIEAAGGRYVDVAVMAPVRPALLAVPLLLAGPHAPEGLLALEAMGFAGRVVEGRVGAAAAIKMIRSIAIKGFEAVTAECVLSAYAAGVADEVFASIDRSDPGLAWRKRALYSLERMMLHGVRRADEMQEAAAAASSLGVGGGVSSAVADLQRRIGSLGMRAANDLKTSAASILAAFP